MENTKEINKENKIIRIQPPKYIFLDEKYPNEPEKPGRITKEEFDNYDKLKKDSNFNKWRSGINPDTGRKIQVTGKVHNQLRYTYKYNTIEYYNALDKINDIKEYIKRTELLMDNYNKKKEYYNKEKDRVEKLIETNLNSFNEKFKNIINWDDYVEYKGEYYGIPHITYINDEKNHNENDCKGKLFFDSYGPCECHLCEDWNGCSNPRPVSIYKCNKCNKKIGDRELRNLNFY